MTFLKAAMKIIFFRILACIDELFTIRAKACVKKLNRVQFNISQLLVQIESKGRLISKKSPVYTVLLL